MFCKWCGNEIDAESSFCPFCGKEVDSSARSVQTASRLDPTKESKKPRRRKLGKKVWIIVGASVLIVAAMLVMLFVVILPAAEETVAEEAAEKEAAEEVAEKEAAEEEAAEKAAAEEAAAEEEAAEKAAAEEEAKMPLLLTSIGDFTYTQSYMAEYGGRIAKDGHTLLVFDLTPANDIKIEIDDTNITKSMEKFNFLKNTEAIFEYNTYPNSGIQISFAEGLITHIILVFTVKEKHEGEVAELVLP